MTEFKLRVVTPDGEVWSSDATSVVIPGVDGYFGVWANHAPMISPLDVGTVMIKTPEETVVEFIAIAGGFVEINPATGVTVLADSAEKASELDMIRADKALERARERLSEHFSDIDVERARVALQKAMNRKRVAERAREKPTSMV